MHSLYSSSSIWLDPAPSKPVQCWDTTASTELENLHGSAGEALWKSQMYTLILFWKTVSLDPPGHKPSHQQPAHRWHQMKDNECPFECLETMSPTAGTLTDSTGTDRPTHVTVTTPVFSSPGPPVLVNACGK